MKGTNMETWMAEFSKQLAKALEEKPEDYIYGEDMLPIVLERIAKAFKNRSYNKDSTAIRRTCKALGIAHTYKAINNFIADYS